MSYDAGSFVVTLEEWISSQTMGATPARVALVCQVLEPYRPEIETKASIGFDAKSIWQGIPREVADRVLHVMHLQRPPCGHEDCAVVPGMAEDCRAARDAR